MNLNFKPFGDDEDFFVPIKDGADKATIEVLQAAPAHYTFYVDVSNTPSDAAMRIFERAKRRMRLALLLDRLKRMFGDDDMSAAPAG